MLLGVIQGAPSGGYLAARGSRQSRPPGFLYLNLALAALIPTAGLSIWVAHRIRPRYLSSVAGGLRWRWLLRCLLVTLPVWLIYTGLGFLASRRRHRPAPDHWVLLLIMVVVLTPFQSAGEEYLFRGWIMQNVGSYFARPLVGLIVSLTVSTVAFSAAHLAPIPGSSAPSAASPSPQALRPGAPAAWRPES